MSLSVVISAYNEEKKIEDCLRSASFAQEIIFVDNTSSDKTTEIARKYTSKIFKRANNLMLNINKNFGFSKAKGDWILSLDADERVSKELEREIKLVIGKKSRVNGYWLPRKNIIFGKWIEHTGWHPDYQLRLIRRDKGRFPEQHVHEMIKVEGTTDYLKSPMVHYNYETLFQFLNKLSIYIPSEANAYIKKGYKVKMEDSIIFPVKEFTSRFFAREGYKDGLHGLVLSLLMAFYHLLVFAYVWEKQGFRKMNENVLLKSETELKKANHDLNYWFMNEKIKSAPILLKIWLKIKRITSF